MGIKYFTLVKVHVISYEYKFKIFAKFLYIFFFDALTSWSTFLNLFLVGRKTESNCLCLLENVIMNGMKHACLKTLPWI